MNYLPTPRTICETGRISGNTIICPLHGAKFDLPTGRCGTPQIYLRPVIVHAVRIVVMSGGFRGLARVLAGIAAATDAGLAPIKINCVVQRGVNDHTILDMVNRFRGTGIIVRFIEYMDVGNRHRWSRDQVVPSLELLRRISACWPTRAIEENYSGEVAERYEFNDGGGEIGFISSVTNPFCDGCTRARLSSEGVLFTCLFASHGRDLRAPLRNGASDEELRERIAGVWRARGDRYSELRAERAPVEHKIEMHYIGG